MAAELVTPIDELTGIPLPLVQTHTHASERFAPDLHHPFHPRRHDALADLGGNALRHSRVQMVPYEIHHHQYHNTFVGPELPDDELGKFKLVVMAAAGYVPDQAITFNTSGEPETVALHADYRNYLRQPKQMRVGSPKSVQDFLVQYTIQQDLTSIKNTTLDEFLYTTNTERRWQLGNAILGEASFIAAHPIKEIYRTAYQSELIPPDRARAASRALLSMLCRRKQRGKLFGLLSNQISSAA